MKWEADRMDWLRELNAEREKTEALRCEVRREKERVVQLEAELEELRRIVAEMK